MSIVSLYPSAYQGDDTDYLKVKADRSGAARTYAGSITVPSGFVADLFIGLVPFNKGARFTIGDKSVYAGNFGGGSTTLNLGYIYDDNTTYTNNVDAWASLSTAAQSGGFITVDESDGVDFVAEADGWIAVQVVAANTDAEAVLKWNFDGSYDGLSVNNQNNQS